jgi:pilus assembly protein CpaE
MSQDSLTSILLPTSRVAIYAAENDTAQTAQKLTLDWRFSRVTLDLEQGGIEAAIANYTNNASPELIIIETNDISEAFIAQLGGLAGVCAAGTDAVIIGPTNDVHLYRSLVNMGVKDYLVRPVAEEDMIKVIARTLIEKRGLAGSRLVAVMGSKGGVGTTAVAQALAWNISETLQQTTILMDLTGSYGSLGIGYGLEPPATLSDVVRIGGTGSDDDMKRVCQTVTERLSLLISGGEPLMSDRPDADSIEILLNRVMQKNPVVIVDLSGAAPATQKRILTRAAEIVIVSTPLLSSLRNARTLLNEIKTLRAGLKDVDLVVNMQGLAPAEEMAERDIKTALGLTPSATIPFAPKIFLSAESAGKTIGHNKAAEEILTSLMEIAQKSAAVDYKKEDKAKKTNPLDLFKSAIGKVKTKS